MSGLEAVEINLSELERTHRIDSEFYKKENLTVLSILDKTDHAQLTCYFTVSDGNHMSISHDFREEGIRYYRGGDSHNFFIEESNPICISEEIYNLPVMKRSHLAKNDILLSIVGTIGNVCLVRTNDEQTCNCKLAILRQKQDGKAMVTAVFLRSKYGQNQIQKFKRGAVQMGFLLEDTDQVIMPVFSSDFCIRIEKVVERMNAATEQSTNVYTAAEQLLLQELGLISFTPSTDSVAVKSFAESFGTSGRLDAEYYQPKYEEFEALLSKVPRCRIEDICTHINYGTVPTSPYTDDGTGIPYIKGMNLVNLCIRNALDRITDTEDLPDKFYVRKGDIVISQMGTVGDVGVISEDEKGYLFASFTIRVRIKDFKKYNPYFVGMYIQHIAKKWYLLRNIAQASVRQNTDLPTIRNMPIPALNIKTQEEIASRVQQSFSLRRQSEQLLETAKQAVEMAIEQGEAAAVTWLESVCNE